MVNNLLKNAIEYNVFMMAQEKSKNQSASI